MENESVKQAGNRIKIIGWVILALWAVTPFLPVFMVSLGGFSEFELGISFIFSTESNFLEGGWRLAVALGETVMLVGGLLEAWPIISAGISSEYTDFENKRLHDAAITILIPSAICYVIVLMALTEANDNGFGVIACTSMVHFTMIPLIILSVVEMVLCKKLVPELGKNVTPITEEEFARVEKKLKESLEKGLITKKEYDCARNLLLAQMQNQNSCDAQQNPAHKKGDLFNGVEVKISSNFNSPVIQNSSAQKAEELDLLLKYKQLYDNGVITKEEFEAKKNEILNK